METSGFDKLLTRKVPHIHEKILLSMDYETFMNCQGVCKTWDDLLVAESFRKKAYSLYREEMDRALVIKSGHGNAEVVKHLLLRGANPNCIGRALHWMTFRGTPLTWAGMTGSLDVAKTLLDHGADPNRATQDGFTPLLLSLVCNEAPLEVVILLLEKGADPKRASGNGTSPLHVAARQGNGDVVKALLDQGGYTNGANRAGETPISIATNMGNDEMIQLIQNAAPEN